MNIVTVEEFGAVSDFMASTQRGLSRQARSLLVGKKSNSRSAFSETETGLESDLPSSRETMVSNDGSADNQ